MSEEKKHTNMQYRLLGPTGIKASVISFGTWVNTHNKDSRSRTIQCVKKAWELGINYFDTAQGYGFGESQSQLGEALKKLKVPREHYIVSTKLFWFSAEAIPNMNGLSRKHIIEGLKGSLKRLDLQYIDIVYCHRAQYDTPMQQICRAFDWIIRKGHAFYWGTSQWNPDDIAQAHMVCEKYCLIKPVLEQSEYNLFNRDKIQFGYRHLFKDKKMGITVYSPLAGGLLTGKYKHGIPEGSRYDKNPDLKKIFNQRFKQGERETTIKALDELEKIAGELNCSMAQLAMAWVINNPDVNIALTGCTSPEQLQDTVKAVCVRRLLNKDIEKRIELAFKTLPYGKLDMPKGRVYRSRRFQTLGYFPPGEEDGKTQYIEHCH